MVRFARSPDPRIVETVAWNFDKFTLLADRRLLMAGGLPVRLGGRALDVLIALVEYAGQFVSRDELIQRIWGARVVEGINLRVQVATLRRLLGDDGRGDPRFIVNVPAKGYCFVAPVTRIGNARKTPRERQAAGDLPLRLTPLRGRDAAVGQLVDALKSCRIVTLVGAGGVGKSAVAIEVAGEMVHCHCDGVLHADLSGVADAHLACERIAAALEGDEAPPAAPEEIVAALSERQLLLFLDGCEGVIDLVALLAERMLDQAPHVLLLATSREPLRIPGERVHRLASLGVPPAGASVSLDRASSWPSVQLLLDRMDTGDGSFEPSADDMRRMSALCRRLDGMPLAIELAAHCMAHLGATGVIEQLDEGFDVLVDERRKTPAHHRSLRASFDWSFCNLMRQEQAVLTRLSVFSGAFSLASGAHLASKDGMAHDRAVRELIGQLATKSLIAVETGQGGVHYRLPGITRAYARDRLRAQGEVGTTSLRHARWVAGLFDRSRVSDDSQVSAANLSQIGAELDELRVALDWLSQVEDVEGLRMRLLAASVAHWFRIAAVVEFGHRVNDALRNGLGGASESDRAHVLAGLGHARLQACGPDADAISTAREALARAESLDDQHAHLIALWGLWFAHSLAGDHAVALGVAERYGAIRASAGTASSAGVAISFVTDKHATLVVSAGAGSDISGDVMLLVSLTNLGRHSHARTHGERVLTGRLLMPTDGARTGSQLEGEAIGRSSLARLLWIQGHPEKALAMARDAVELARHARDDLTACFCLHDLCVIALWVGDRETANVAAGSLADVAARHRLGYWAAWARFDGAAAGLPEGGAMGTGWRDPVCGLPQLELMTTLCTDLPEPEVMSRAEAGQASWCEPEVLRARGCQATLLETERGRLKGLALFERALLLARSQGALSWELRAATSLAAISIQPRERSMAIHLLTTALARFSEGFNTRDLRRAADLLEKLRSK